MMPLPKIKNSNKDDFEKKIMNSILDWSNIFVKRLGRSDKYIISNAVLERDDS